MAEDKTRVATACMCGCSGCHMSFLDVDEYIKDLAEEVEFVASHVIMDAKGFEEVDIGILEGTITNEENVEVAEELRENCDILVAWGDCACFGGIMTMRNFEDVDEILEECYKEKGDEKSEMPTDDSIPTLTEKAKGIDEIVEVDAYIPGCPPSAELIKYGFEELLEGRTPKLDKDRLIY